MEPRKFWSMKAATAEPGVGHVDIMGDIVFGQWDKWSEDDVAASEFKQELDALGDVKVIKVSINSYGGDVFAGQAIHSMLASHPASVEVTVLGVAASIASVIAMAGDTVVMPANAMMMVHNPWTIAMGNADYMRKLADDLDIIGESLIAAYMRKLEGKTTVDELKALLDGETWLTAQQAFDMGFADLVTEQMPVAAAASPLASVFMHTPDALKAALPKGVETPDMPNAAERDRIVAAATDSTMKAREVLSDLSFSIPVD